MKKIISTTVWLFIFSLATNAQSGTLDESFSKNGKAFYEEFTGNCLVLALQKDGKIVTAGFYDVGIFAENGFLISRVNPDGSLDESFGDRGKTIVANAEGNNVGYADAIAVQEDGKIVVAGRFIDATHYANIGLIRLNSNGKLDSSFDANGITSLNLGVQDDIVGGMILQSDGKIIVAGKRGLNSDGDTPPVYAVRYHTDGSLDKTFGDNGIVITPEGSDFREIDAVALQSDGKILLGGKFFSGSLGLMRYLPDGSLDLSFDENKDGIASIRFEDKDIRYSALYDIAVQTDGKIVAGGMAGEYESRMAIMRFNSDGSVDSAFGDKTGYSVLYMTSGGGTAYNVAVQADKKIVLMGQYYPQAGEDGFGAVRYNVDGSIDSSFGENGIGTDGFTNLNAAPAAGILQKDGKILLGGAGSSNDGSSHIALMRFNNVITPTPPEFAKIQKWKGHYGFSWDDWSGNKTTYYSVGRSTNASTFTEIAQVTDVKGITSYKYQDPAPPAGIVYYQLSAYRTDDKVVSSNIVTCGDDVLNNFIKLYPNPAKNSLRIEGLSAKEKTKLTIIDLSGNIKVTAVTTASSHTLNIAQLMPGNYMLRIETNGNLVTRMFVKE